MHIIFGLLAAISMLGVVLWRLNNAADAAKDIADKADDARGLLRRWSWRRKLAADTLALISDPREAAAAMMVATAQADGAMTERERSAILDAFTQTFEAGPAQSEELLAHARWLTKDVRDLSSCYRRLQPLIRATCAPEQIDELLAMIADVANADGQPDAMVSDAVARLRRDLAR